MGKVLIFTKPKKLRQKNSPKLPAINPAWDLQREVFGSAASVHNIVEIKKDEHRGKLR